MDFSQGPWLLRYNRTLKGQPLGEPIAPVQINTFLRAKFLQVRVTIRFKTHWYRAGWLSQTVALNGKSTDTAKALIALNQTHLIEFPTHNSGYQLRFEAVRWVPELTLMIWEYTGPEQDSTEELLQTLKVDIARLEYRIGNLLE